MKQKCSGGDINFPLGRATQTGKPPTGPTASPKRQDELPASLKCRQQPAARVQAPQSEINHQVASHLQAGPLHHCRKACLSHSSLFWSRRACQWLPFPLASGQKAPDKQPQFCSPLSAPSPSPKPNKQPQLWPAFLSQYLVLPILRQNKLPLLQGLVLKMDTPKREIWAPKFEPKITPLQLMQNLPL